jgi:hypothetical protein
LRGIACVVGDRAYARWYGPVRFSVEFASVNAFGPPELPVLAEWNDRTDAMKHALQIQLANLITKGKSALVSGDFEAAVKASKRAVEVLNRPEFYVKRVETGNNYRATVAGLRHAALLCSTAKNAPVNVPLMNLTAEYEGHTYALLPSLAFDWESAQLLARAFGGDLLTVESQGQLLTARALLTRSLPGEQLQQQRGGFLWLGAERIEDQPYWRWNSGAPIDSWLTITAADQPPPAKPPAPGPQTEFPVPGPKTHIAVPYSANFTAAIMEPEATAAIVIEWPRLLSQP